MSGTGQPERAGDRPHEGAEARGDEPRGFTPWPNQDENGVDLTLIRANLKLSPLERVRRAEALRRQVLRLHELAGIKRHQKPA